ncbi:MAG: hypothetical protein ACKKMS_00135 [Candidatus Nealsonbacteria bacterium]
MIKLKFQVKIDAKLKELVERGTELIDNDIASVFERGLVGIVASAIKDCPVDTGRLRTDIGHKFNRRKLEAIIYNTVEYSVYVHEGTRYMRTRPYILRAIKDKGEIQMRRELERNVLKEYRGL